MVLYDLQNAEHKLTEKDLTSISGGASLSGSFINSFTDAVKTVYGMGQDFGGSMRRIATGNLCKI